MPGRDIQKNPDLAEHELIFLGDRLFSLQFGAPHVEELEEFTEILTRVESIFESVEPHYATLSQSYKRRLENLLSIILLHPLLGEDYVRKYYAKIFLNIEDTIFDNIYTMRSNIVLAENLPVELMEDIIRNHTSVKYGLIENSSVPTRIADPLALEMIEQNIPGKTRGILDNPNVSYDVKFKAVINDNGEMNSVYRRNSRGAAEWLTGFGFIEKFKEELELAQNQFEIEVPAEYLVDIHFTHLEATNIKEYIAVLGGWGRL